MKNLTQSLLKAHVLGIAGWIQLRILMEGVQVSFHSKIGKFLYSNYRGTDP